MRRRALTIILPVFILLLMCICFVHLGQDDTSGSVEEYVSPETYLEVETEDIQSELDRSTTTSQYNEIEFSYYGYEGEGYDASRAVPDNQMKNGLSRLGFVGPADIQEPGKTFVTKDLIMPTLNAFSGDIDRGLSVCYQEKEVSDYSLGYDSYGSVKGQTVWNGIYVGPVGFGKIILEKKGDDGKYSLVMYDDLFIKEGDGYMDNLFSPLISGDDFHKGTEFRLTVIYLTVAEVKIGTFLPITEHVKYRHIETASFRIIDGNVEGAVTLGTERESQSALTIDDGAFVEGALRLNINNPYVDIDVTCNGESAYSKARDEKTDKNFVDLNLDGLVTVAVSNDYGYWTKNLYVCNDVFEHYSINELIEGKQQFSPHQNTISFIDHIIVKLGLVEDNHIPMNIRLFPTGGYDINLKDGPVRLERGEYNILITIGVPGKGTQLKMTSHIFVEDVYEPSFNFDALRKYHSIPEKAFVVSIPSKSDHYAHVLFGDQYNAYQFSYGLYETRGYYYSEIAWERIEVVNDLGLMDSLDPELAKISGGVLQWELESDVYFYYSESDRLKLSSNSKILLSPDLRYYYIDDNGNVQYRLIDYEFMRDELGWESSKITLVDGDGKSHGIQYGTSLINQLESLGVQGKLTIIEENISGGTSKYDIFYVHEVIV